MHPLTLAFLVIRKVVDDPAFVGREGLAALALQFNLLLYQV